LFTRDSKQPSKLDKNGVDKKLLGLKIFDDADFEFFTVLAIKLGLKFELDVKTLWYGISSPNRKSLAENIVKHPYELMCRFLRHVKTKHYMKLLLDKKAAENDCIEAIMFNNMIECDLQMFIDLIQGKSYVDTDYGPKPPIKYVRTTSQLYIDLINTLTDPLKLWILTTGRDCSGCIIWNNGMIVDLTDALSDKFAAFNLSEKFDSVNMLQQYGTFKNMYGFRYRPSGMHNRHLHCTDNPSFYALSNKRCRSQSAYFKTISDDEQVEYLENHKRYIETHKEHISSRYLKRHKILLP
jgi:hypothetical protein